MRRWRCFRRALRAMLLSTLAALAAVVGAGPAAAQVEAPLTVDRVDTSAHPRVFLTVTAPRELVGEELTGEHFSLVEGGSPRPVEVSALPNDRLEVVLVIDTSGSMQGDAIAEARAAAIDFVRVMPAEALVGVVGFGDEPAVLARLGTPHDELVAAIEAVEPGGETALYDAIVTTTGQLAAASSPNARRYVVLLSDGGDTASEAALQHAVDGLAGSGAGFHAIALATPDSDLGALGELAQAAEGKVVAASEPSEIARVYDGIASELVNQYRVTYTSTSEGVTSLELTVSADDVVGRWAERIELPALPAAATAVEPEGPAAYVAPEPGLLADRRLLAASVVPFAFALAIAGWLFASSRAPRPHLIAAKGIDRQQAAAFLSGVAGRATEMAERVLDSSGRSGRLNRALEAAGLAVRPAEFLVLVGSATAGAGAVGLLLAGPLGALGLAGLAVAGSWWTLSWLTKRRRRLLADQLGDTLQLLSGSLRSGHGLVQALDQVTREAESPTAEEFHRVIVESRLGRDLTESLRALADRADSEDLRWVVQAIRIHREVGGDLAQILDRVAETIRDRNRVRGQVRSLTAEGRLSAIVLMALPFLVGGWMWVTNRPYIEELFVRPTGRVVLAVGAVLMVVGAAVLKRMIRPEF